MEEWIDRNRGSSGVLNRWAQKRQDRKLEKFGQRAGHMFSDFKKMKAAVFVSSALEEIESGIVRSDAEWGAQWADQSDDSLVGILAYCSSGLKQLVTPQQFATMNEAIRSNRPIPSSVTNDPLVLLLTGRVRYLVALLQQRVASAGLT